MSFRGSFDHTLDAKNRLTVPARFRAELSSGVVLAKGIEPCVAIWTPQGYEAQIDLALAGENPFSPRARQLKRFFAAGAQETELDSANRVMIPGFLLAHGQLTKDVVVIGAEDWIEVWNPAAWRTQSDELDRQVADITESLGHPS